MCDRHHIYLMSKIKLQLDTLADYRGTRAVSESVKLSAKADELMRYSAPTPQLASTTALKVGQELCFFKLYLYYKNI